MNNNEPKPSQSNVKIIVILSIIALFFGVFYFALSNVGGAQKVKIRDVPVFSMPALFKEDGFVTSEDIKDNAPLLVNIWASWCAPCRLEHPLLEKLKTEHNVKIIGINFKDNPDNAQKFIEKYGNPFFKIGTDVDGLLTLNWGLRGVPETFVISADGKIIYKHQGEIKEPDLKNLLSALKEGESQK